MAAGRIRKRGLTSVFRSVTAMSLAAAMIFAPLAWADRTEIKPGWNIFSPADDIKLGQKVALDTEHRLPMLDDQRVDDYLNALGRKLAGFAPGAIFPYEFHCVNQREINSFAIPGGFIFINRGIIEEARDEAQLAGVMAHEISHVALRHGTNQATKKQVSSGVLGILGGVVGGGMVAGIASQIGGGLASSTILLKYSRASESQADILGTQILYDAGYDPRAMAQFFENILAQNAGRKLPEFFADHPIPAHRIDRVEEEIDKMGGPPENYKTDSQEFRDVRRYVLSLPDPIEKGRRVALQSLKPAIPSSSMVDFNGVAFSAKYPENWEANLRGDSVSFIPSHGLVNDAQGNPVTAYGVVASLFQPPTDSISSSLSEMPPASTLGGATDQFLSGLEQSNPNLKSDGVREVIQLDGQPALSMHMVSESPLGGEEDDWIVTVLRPQGLLYFICASPTNESRIYHASFQKFFSSVRLSK